MALNDESLVMRFASTRPPDSPAMKAALLRDEWARQHAILRRDMPMRIAASALAYGLAMAFVAPLLVLACMLADLAGETLAARLQRHPEKLHRPLRYRLYLAAVFVSEGSFALPAAVMWHMDEPYVKALAVGLVASAMMHSATVRAIHLPMGLAGASALCLLALASNTAYWLRQGDMLPLAVSTLCAVVAFGYFIAAMASNHALHREAARARADAEVANAAKDRFLAQMSHELRTPLNAILGMGRAELRRSADAVSRDRLSVLIRAAEGLSTILDDILDLSAVQEGRLPLRVQAVNLRDELAATLTLFRPALEETGLRLHLDLAPALPAALRLDPQRLRQCLSNLLAQVMKQPGEGCLHIAAAPVAGEAGRSLLRIAVTDSRAGAGDAWRQHTDADSGPALALSIARALAQQMGGDLVPEPLLPEQPGNRLVLTLPLVKTEAMPDTQRPFAPQATAADSAGPLAGCRVLVVDDIATNRMVASAYLGLLGAQSVEAASGTRALELAGDPALDLVLLDMNMPGMDGLETFRRLRAMDGAVAALPVVAMTADAMPEHRRACLEAGMDGYVSKPMSPDALAKELLRVLATRPLN
jgi:CheY-like chemotaxis protein